MRKKGQGRVGIYIYIYVQKTSIRFRRGFVSPAPSYVRSIKIFHRYFSRRFLVTPLMWKGSGVTRGFYSRGERTYGIVKGLIGDAAGLIPGETKSGTLMVGESRNTGHHGDDDRSTSMANQTLDLLTYSRSCGGHVSVGTV